MTASHRWQPTVGVMKHSRSDSQDQPRRPVAAVGATFVAVVAGLYAPPLAAAWWMWDGGQMNVGASLVFTAGPAVAWLLWLRVLLSTAPPRTSASRNTVTATAIATVGYMAVTTWDVTVGVPPSSVSVWPPAVVVSVVGVAAIARRVVRLHRP